jgi:hypothetical protein
VVATEAALDGLDGVTSAGAIAANDTSSFAAAVAPLLAVRRDNDAGRTYVSERFGWEASLGLLDRLLERAA